MKTLNDLGLTKKTQKKVEAWLQGWLTLFEKQADNKEAWVYRCDFEKSDFFWFTNCKDILEKDPEAKGQENNLAIRSRKRKIMMQLFLKTLLGRKLGLITITCNHCGHRGCWIESLKDGNGHWVHCPKCKKTDVHVFPDGYDTCMDKIKQEIDKRAPYFQERLAMSPSVKGFLKEIQAYKYEHGKKIETHANPSTINIVNTFDPSQPLTPFTATLGKFCPKCEYPMTDMPIYLDTSLTPVDGWHCPRCMYQMAKRKVPKGAWSTTIKGNKETTICPKCGYEVPKKSYGNYATGMCNHCYFEESRQ